MCTVWSALTLFACTACVCRCVVCRSERLGDREAVATLLRHLMSSDYRIFGLDAKVCVCVCVWCGLVWIASHLEAATASACGCWHS